MGPEVVDLRDHVREYTAQVRFIVPLYKQLDRDENKGGQGQLRTAVQTVEARIGGFGPARLLAKLVMLRRHEMDFLLREILDYVEYFDQRQLEFAELLADVAIPASVKQHINALMKAHGDGFHTWGELSVTLRDEIGRLVAISDKMVPAFERFH